MRVDLQVFKNYNDLSYSKHNKKRKIFLEAFSTSSTYFRPILARRSELNKVRILNMRVDLQFSQN